MRKISSAATPAAAVASSENPHAGPRNKRRSKRGAATAAVVSRIARLLFATSVP
jgi:hypothetical protein